jgi:hypothetical protein
MSVSQETLLWSELRLALLGLPHGQPQPLLRCPAPLEHQLGRAFSIEIARREIEAITDLDQAKSAALLLLEQVRLMREMADLLVRNDWLSSQAAFLERPHSERDEDCAA